MDESTTNRRSPQSVNNGRINGHANGHVAQSGRRRNPNSKAMDLASAVWGHGQDDFDDDPGQPNQQRAFGGSRTGVGRIKRNLKPLKKEEAGVARSFGEESDADDFTEAHDDDGFAETDESEDNGEDFLLGARPRGKGTPDAAAETSDEDWCKSEAFKVIYRHGSDALPGNRKRGYRDGCSSTSATPPWPWFSPRSCIGSGLVRTAGLASTDMTIKAAWSLTKPTANLPTRSG